MQTRRSLVLGGLVLTVGCARAQPQLAAASEADVAAVTQLAASMDSSAGTLDAFMSHFADDVVVLMPDEMPIEGKAAAQDWYQNTFSTYYVAQHYAPAEVHSVGNLLVSRGDVSGTWTPKAGTQPLSWANKFLMLLLRQTDGSLRIWRLALSPYAQALEPPPIPQP